MLATFATLFDYTRFSKKSFIC